MASDVRPIIMRLLAILSLPMLTPAIASDSYARHPAAPAFVQEMSERHGFAADELRALLAQVRPLPAVLRLIAPPADPAAVRSWQRYRAHFVEPRRIEAGKRFWRQHAASLARTSARSGVPAEIIVAIIGVETVYGANVGRFPTFAALATLTFDYPPRAPLFRRELEALLLLAREQGRSPLAYRGSYAGALGLPQFLPSSIRAYAVDGDGDGRIDLFASTDDVIASVANFLTRHGWQEGGPIALPARIDADIADVTALLAEGIEPRRRPAEMPGIVADTPGPAPDEAAALIDLVTPGEATEYWLGYRNFYVLTRYNRSSFYAMSVFRLAEALRTNAP